MLEDLYDYDHPSLFVNLTESAAIRRARRSIGKSRNAAKTREWYRHAAHKKVRRAIKLYLRHDDEPRIDSRAMGDSWEIW